MSIWEERAPSWLRSEGSPLSKSRILSFSPNYTIRFRSDVNIYLNLQFGTCSDKHSLPLRLGRMSFLGNDKVDVVIVSGMEGYIGPYSIISMSSVFMWSLPVTEEGRFRSFPMILSSIPDPSHLHLSAGPAVCTGPVACGERRTPSVSSAFANR